MNLNPFIILISQIISLYSFLIIVYCVLGLLINVNILNKNNKYIYKLISIFGEIIDPLLNKIRKYLPNLGSLDISPIIAIFFLTFIKNVLFTYFYVK